MGGNWVTDFDDAMPAPDVPVSRSLLEKPFTATGVLGRMREVMMGHAREVLVERHRPLDLLFLERAALHDADGIGIDRVLHRAARRRIVVLDVHD